MLVACLTLWDHLWLDPTSRGVHLTVRRLFLLFVIVSSFLFRPQGKGDLPEWASSKVTVGTTRWCSTSSITPWGSIQPWKASDWWGVQITAGEQLCSAQKHLLEWRCFKILSSEDHGTLFQRHDGRLRAISVHGQSSKTDKSQESDRDR